MLEAVISMSILGLLTGLIFFVYTMGARAWAKGDAKSELLRASQIVAAKTSRLVESSTPLSVSVAADGSATAFLSAEDSNGVFRYDPVSLLPRWQKFVVLYHEPVSKTVFYREVDVTRTPLESAPQPIDALGNGPVENYKTGGNPQPLGRGIDTCRFTLTPESQLLTELSSTQQHYGSETPETRSTRFLNTFRN